MIIKKLRADFGVLTGAEMELSDGLNVIELPNESGKSTWCAFIRAMLYGVDSSERAKAGYKPDKTKYAPWSGVPMRGEMELEFGGRDITLTRTTRSANSPMREFSAVYSGTGEPVPALTGANAGEVLTGAARAVFERSAFIKQAGVGVSGSPELEKRIGALVSSGSEEDSYDEADSRLRAWQRARRYNKRGRIPEIETRIADMDDSLRALRSAAAQRDDLRAELERAEAELPQIRAEIAEERKQKRRAALERLSEGKRLLHEHETAAEKASEELEERKKELAQLPFEQGADPGTVLETAKADAAAAAEYARSAQKTTGIVSVIIPLAAALAAVLLAILVSPIVFAAAAVCAAVCVVMLLRRKKDAENSAAALGLRSELLQRYRAEDEDGITRMAERYAVSCAAAAAAEKERERAYIQLESTRESQRELDSGILSELDVSSSGRRLSDAQARVAQLREQLAKAEGGLDVMGDPMAIGSEKIALQEKLDELGEQYEALEIAITALREANAEIQTRFSPMLGRRAGELFAALTDGRYESLSLGRDFSALVRERGAAVGHDGVFLSAGAQDQLYLAVRLAICELVLDGEEKTPIILDDALCAFDDSRMALAMALLRELARDRQIILFTCHGREKAFLDREAEN